MRALIIEDDEFVAKGLNHILESLAKDRQIVTKMRQAFAALSEAPADIITVDLLLPPNGRDETINQSLPALRAMCPDALIIVVTGLALNDTANACIKAGADGMFEKMEVATEASFMQRMRELVVGIQKHPTSREGKTRIVQAVAQSIAERANRDPSKPLKSFDSVL